MINEDLFFGLDLGIGSCGWAVLRADADAGDAGRMAIERLGSWCFDVPETDKERTPTNQVRRANRLARRVLRRRRGRMADLRRLFHARGLLASADREALRCPEGDPWVYRRQGLDQLLAPKAFAVALGHIAKRRGFKSAAKRRASNAPADDKKMLSVLAETEEHLGRYRTVGEMFSDDPKFAGRHRNRDGVFDRTVSREDLVREVAALFAAQRRLGSAFASQTLEADFTAIAFRQLPMQDADALVGACRFEPAEQRSARLAPSYEMFRLLTRLVSLRIKGPAGERTLTPEELALATTDLGRTAKLTVKRVRGLIGLKDDERFTAIKPDEETHDIVSRTGEAMVGTAALRGALGESAWTRLRARPETVDAIAQILSFFETNETIATKLGDLGLDGEVRTALLAGLDAGAFARFKGAGQISAKACRVMIPHLRRAMTYDKACAAAGYDHAVSVFGDRPAVTTKADFNALVALVGEGVANPIARKALTEGLKQLWAMRNRWGLPGAIHIEMARDVGNSLEQRRELDGRLRETTAQRERERAEVRTALGLADVDGETLLRYRLWKEQAGKCPYTGADIAIIQVVATDNSVQVDHILPWSRFGDDSFNNKVLCHAGANQRKKGRTPFEWFSREKSAEDWDTFTARIETNKQLRGFKKRNLLLKSAAEVEDKFRSRNLNDTRYACRLLADAVKLFYPPGQRQDKGGRRRIFTRPGALTSALRRAWGLESLKKVDGQRVDDARHHAIDALTVAAVGEGEVQRLTRSFQEWEQRGQGRALRWVDPPWVGFRDDVLAAYQGIFVARPERRRARGKGHDATIRRIARRDDAELVSERKSVDALEMGDLDRVQDPQRNAALIEALRRWIAEKKPKDAPPISPQGNAISKVRLVTKKKVGVKVRGGTADRGEIARMDVFAKPKRSGKAAGRDEYFIVPIYPHQIADRRAFHHPPAMAAKGGVDSEAAWEPMDETARFLFSLYPRSYVEVVKKDGTAISGYLKSFDRSVAAIIIGYDGNLQPIEKKTGVKTLDRISKYSVDRLGYRFIVKSEVRTWHGEVCTSPNPPD